MLRHEPRPIFYLLHHACHPLQAKTIAANEAALKAAEKKAEAALKQVSALSRAESDRSSASSLETERQQPMPGG